MFKICYIVSSPLTVKSFLHSHLTALVEKYDLTLLVNLSEGTRIEGLAEQIRCIHVPINRKISPFQDTNNIFRLFGILYKERFDVAISLTPKAGLLAMVAAKISGVPLRLHIFTGQVWATRRGLYRWILKSMDRLTAACASEVLVDSPSQRDFLIKEGVVTKVRSSVVADGSICGVDTQRFYPNRDARLALREKLGIHEETFMILFMGRMYREKGVFELAEAFQSLHAEDPNTCLVFVGKDEEGVRPLLERREGVFLHEHTDRPEEYFAASDVFCLPSHREGFGLVIIEAAACGVPTIGSNIYGISDAIVDGETGLLHEAKNTVDLARCIRKLARDRSLTNRLGRQAQERATRLFSKGRVVEEFVAYLTQRIDSHRRS